MLEEERARARRDLFVELGRVRGATFEAVVRIEDEGDEALPALVALEDGVPMRRVRLFWRGATRRRRGFAPARVSFRGSSTSGGSAKP